MQDHRHNGQEHGDTAVKEVEVVAQFPSDRQAQHAEQAIHDQAKSTTIQPGDSHAAPEPEEAEMGISTVEIGWFAWLGLVAGIVIGGVLGWSVFIGAITLPGVASAMGAGATAVIFLGAGILGSVGWFIGALIHLFRDPNAPQQHELHAVVPEGEWQQVGEAMVDAGAVNVLVPGNQHHNGEADEQHHAH